MSIRIGLVVLVAIVTEVLAILALVLVVAVAGPTEPAAAQSYAEEIGYWLGPVAGFVLCVAGGWFVASRVPKHRLLNGFAVGAVAAAIDIAILVASGTDFLGIYVISNIGRIAAGSIGGLLAGRGAA